MPLTKDKYFELIDSNSDYPHFRCALGAYIPGSLYKYFSIPDDSDEARKRFEQLKSGEIWFSKRSGLNDPFEFEHIALKGAQNDARQYYHPEEVTQLMLGETVSNIKEDRTDLDLLYACLLDWGVEINLSHTSTQVAGCTVHNVDNGALAACFDKAVPRAVVEYIANLQPLRAVFRDSAFATDAEKINVTEIFKNLSPDTKVKVI